MKSKYSARKNIPQFIGGIHKFTCGWRQDLDSLGIAKHLQWLHRSAAKPCSCSFSWCTAHTPAGNWSLSAWGSMLLSLCSPGSKKLCFSTCSLNMNSPPAALRLCLPSLSCFPEHISFLQSISSSKRLALTFGHDTKLKYINHRFIYRISKSPKLWFGWEGKDGVWCENYDKTALRLRCWDMKTSISSLINKNTVNSLFS